MVIKRIKRHVVAHNSISTFMFSLNLLVLTEKAVYSVPFNISRLKYIGMIQSDVFLHCHSHVKK